MSRSGYVDDCEDILQYGRWRGRVQSALRGKRGQELLRELRDALDAMPDKRLIADELVKDGEYCALGVLGAKRGIDMEKLDPEDGVQVGQAFGIAPCMAKEIVYMNDEYLSKTPEKRWKEMRRWIDSCIKRTNEEARAAAAVERDIASRGWIRTGWEKEPQEGTNVEISEDGTVVLGTANFVRERCAVNGNPIYGIGWGTDGSDGQKKGLVIVERPTFWRYRRAA